MTRPHRSIDDDDESNGQRQPLDEERNVVDGKRVAFRSPKHDARWPGGAEAEQRCACRTSPANARLPGEVLSCGSGIISES